MNNYLQCKADEISNVYLILVSPIPRITTVLVILLPKNFKATDSLISEQSVPESK